LTGDVATDADHGYANEGGQLYQRLIKAYPYFDGLFMSKADGADYDYGVLSFYAKLFHIPRRILFDEAPAICLPAMIEMEKIPNWLEFNRLVATKDEIETSRLFYEVKDIKKAEFSPINSYTKMLLKLFQKYETEHSKADGKGKSTRIHYPDFDVTILSHEWNLGSALASKWSMIATNSGHPKAQFVINDIPNREIHISGRGPKEVFYLDPDAPAGMAGVMKRKAGIHIGKVFKMASPDIMVGGGLQPAGSAKGLVNDPELILNELVKAVKRSQT
jgi:hypothetical protein